MLAALVAAIVVGAALQSATGFGFSLLAAPIVFAFVDPQPAIGLMALLGLEVNLLTILTEGRRPEPLRRETLIITLASLPGALLGVVVLRSLDAVALQVLLSVAVVAMLVVRHLAVRQSARATGTATAAPAVTGVLARPRWSAPVAGLSAGALSTSTSASGPPLLLHLLGRGLPPVVMRDTLSVCFLALGLVTPIALVVTASTEAVPGGSLVAALVPAAVVGHVAGRRAFRWLASSSTYEPIVTAVLLVAVVIGLAGAVAG